MTGNGGSAESGAAGMHLGDGLGSVRTGFVAAADRAGVHEERFSIGGTSVVLRFAGAEAATRLSPAFAHLLSDSGTASPALTVNIWDSATAGVQAPTFPGVSVDEASRATLGTIESWPDDGSAPEKSDASGPIYYIDDPPLRAVYLPHLEAISVFDREASAAWHWVADARTQPYWVEAAPIRQILHWWLGAQGLIQLHGGAIGTPDGGVLVVGKGGSGKSTVSLSSLGSELRYAGDDYVAVSLGETPWIHSLYGSGKLNPPHVRRFLPWLVPLLANQDRLAAEKAVVYVDQYFPEQMISGFPLRAVLVPRVRLGETEPRIVPISRVAALAALAPSTILQLHPPDPQALATMCALVARIPCYGLELGSDVKAIPGVVAELLGQLAAEGVRGRTTRRRRS